MSKKKGQQTQNLDHRFDIGFLLLAPTTSDMSTRDHLAKQWKCWVPRQNFGGFDPINLKGRLEYNGTGPAKEAKRSTGLRSPDHIETPRTARPDRFGSILDGRPPHGQLDSLGVDCPIGFTQSPTILIIDQRIVALDHSLSEPGVAVSMGVSSTLLILPPLAAVTSISLS